MLSMVDLAAAQDFAALSRAWSAVSIRRFLPADFSATASARLQQDIGVDEIKRYRRMILDEARPVLDGRISLFLDENRPFTRTALRKEGFDSSEGAIVLVDRARDLEVVSRDSSETLIASALTLLLSSRRSSGASASPDAGRKPKISLLDHDEKMHLIKAAKGGNVRATGRLLFFYQPLIGGIVGIVKRRLRLSDADADDLLQIARMHFMGLVKSYDPDKGAGFETYTRRFILLHLLKAAADESNPIYRPAGRRLDSIRMDNARWRLRGELGRNPHDEELAERVGIGVAQLREEQIERSAIVSLSSSTTPGGETVFEGTVSGCDSQRPDNAFLDIDLRGKLDRAIENSGLSGDEIAVLRGCYLDGHSVKHMGGMLGFTGAKVRELIRSAVRKISSGPFADELRQLLG
ncbi:MAG: hypothetical protein JXA24_00675 [Proteobacteria bacterium]|nr:hypothetical protein [Pseudomonadota bacterium]